jgi:hypothetical protein
MPFEVQNLYDRISGKMGDEVKVHAGFDGRRWIVGIGYLDEGGGNGLRVFCIRKHGHWVIPGRDGMQLIIGGTDYSAQVGGQLDNLLAMFTQESPAGSSAGPASVAGPAPAARANSVETRRRVVIRE